MAQVVVATRDLQIGTLIGPSDVRMGLWAGALPKDALVKLDAALNRGAIANIYEGEPVLADRLAAAGSGGGLAAIIPPGMRASAVKVNDVVGLAGFVTPGMRVDVLMSGIEPGGNPGDGPRVNTLLQNIQVLSAGENLQKDSEGKPHSVQVVNLLVTPEQAEKLTLAGNQAQIQLVLRNPLDTQTDQPAGHHDVGAVRESTGGSAARAGARAGRKSRTARGGDRTPPPPVVPRRNCTQGPGHRSFQRRGQDRSDIHSPGGSKVKTKLVWNATPPAFSEVMRLVARATPFALPVAWLLTLLFVTAGAQEHRGKEAGPATPLAGALRQVSAASGPDGGQVHAARQYPSDGARFGRPGRLRGRDGRRPQRSAGER